ncbi:MAG: oligoendopeptidase F [Erysipelotrichia bacterium]|nr:oligoendopeptidase F [Erysipelotrichia bacterium]
MITNMNKTRQEVDSQYTWDLSSLFNDETSFLNAVESLKENIQSLSSFVNTLNSKQSIIDCLNLYASMTQKATSLFTYAQLKVSEDSSNQESLLRQGSLASLASSFGSASAFIDVELSQCHESVLKEVTSDAQHLKGYIEEVLRQKPHQLSLDVEKALSMLSTPLNAFYGIYNRSKLADLQFKPFEVNGQSFPLTFNSFENQYEFNTDHEVRRAAFNSFSTQLKSYQHTMAAVYSAHVSKEKALATLRGYESVFDYLLFNQQVSTHVYHNHIDTIYEKLKAPMRHYARLIKKEYGLESLTYADLKLPLDPTFEPTISVSQSLDILKEGLSLLGDDYITMVERSFKERWIDFENNIGKSTGAFCSSPYGVHPFVLINWTERMREAFVLAHELGHAGHFYLAGQHQSIFDTRASLYFIEAPSTINELFVAETLKKQDSSPRFQRWLKATLIARTYYHNFVTHMLEAVYQREVYRLVDQHKPLNAQILNNLMLKTIKDFWGEDVTIQDEAALTWMRQPHYYMGLYPYTYSAGLSIATHAAALIKEEPTKVEAWKSMLKAGGTLPPQELVKLIGIDLSTQETLNATIEFITQTVLDIDKLSS